MTIDTDTDRVRLLISDVGGDSGDDFLFSNIEIDAFLELRGGSVFRAAATALRTAAGNEAQVSKRIRILELDTDGPAVAKELRALAAEYEQTAADEDDAGIDVIEMDVGPFATRNELRSRGLIGDA